MKPTFKENLTAPGSQNSSQNQNRPCKSGRRGAALPQPDLHWVFPDTPNPLPHSWRSLNSQSPPASLPRRSAPAAAPHGTAAGSPPETLSRGPGLLDTWSPMKLDTSTESMRVAGSCEQAPRNQEVKYCVGAACGNATDTSHRGQGMVQDLCLHAIGKYVYTISYSVIGL